MKMPTSLVVFLASAIAISIIGVFLFFQIRKSTQKYNVILISVDTLRSDHMSIYGYKKQTTPYIDAWVKNNGLLFTNVYTLVPQTYPSFATVFTGQSPFANGIYNNGIYDEKERNISYPANIAEDIPTFAEILQKNKYKTAAFVTNGILAKENSNIHRGFQQYTVVDYHQVGLERNKAFLHQSVQWLANNKNTPFFLWIHLTNPHAPYTPEKKFLCTFNQQQCDDIISSSATDLKKEGKAYAGCQNTIPQTVRERQETLYDGTVATTDELVNTMLSKIKELGLFENSLVVFYADHGEGFDHAYYFAHGDVLYESSLKIPFILWVPDVLKSKQIDTLIGNDQIFSTLLDLAHIPHSEFVGKSFADTITASQPSKNPKTQKLYYVNKDHSIYALREGVFKYIYTDDKNIKCQNQEVTEELYNLSLDPQERKNLTGKFPNIAQKMRTDLHLFLRGYGLPQKWEIESHTPTRKDATEKIEELKSLGY